MCGERTRKQKTNKRRDRGFPPRRFFCCGQSCWFSPIPTLLRIAKSLSSHAVRAVLSSMGVMRARLPSHRVYHDAACHSRQEFTALQIIEPKCGPSTLAVHAGEDRQKLGDSITDPIICAATFTFSNTQSAIDYVEQKLPRGEYGRYGNPGERVLERKLAALDAGEDAILFATGMSAIVGLLMAKLSSGDEVIFFDECYHRSREFCAKHMSRFGVVTHQVEACNYQAMEAAITPRTKLLVSESPTNPHLSIVDLQRFSDLGRRHGVETLIDATLATPYNVQPLRYGVDYVLHSATKYLGGHNDLLAGVIVGASQPLESVRTPARHHGRDQLASQYLPAAARFEDIPAADGTPERERAGGGRVPGHRTPESRRSTIRVWSHIRITRWPNARCADSAGWSRFWYETPIGQATARIVDAARIPRIAPSLGGVESLIEQPMVMSYFECSPEQRQDYGIPDNMIRLSCGIEDTDDLVDDLRQALDQ